LNNFSPNPCRPVEADRSLSKNTGTTATHACEKPQLQSDGAKSKIVGKRETVQREVLKSLKLLEGLLLSRAKVDR
jgi:hypothetical protein